MRRALLVVLFASLTAAAFAFKVQRKMADFEVYWTAASRAGRAEPLYRTSDEHYQFKYLPAFAIVMTPLAALPLPVAKQVWFGISVALLVSLLALSLRSMPRPLRLPGWAIVLVTLAVLAKFYAHELVLGQSNLLFASTALLALSELGRRRDGQAGMLFAAAAVVKPYGVIFLPYLVIRKRGRATMGFLITLAFALALPAAWYGFQGNVDLLRGWWSTVVASTEPNLTSQDNVSIAAMYAKWLGGGVAATSLTIVTLVLLGGLCTAVMTKRVSGFPEYLDVALLLTAIPLLSPQGWDYVLLISTPAIMLLVNNLPRFERPLQVLTIGSLAVIGLTLFDVMGRAAYARFMALSGITICYAIVIAMLVSLRVRRMG